MRIRVSQSRIAIHGRGRYVLVGKDVAPHYRLVERVWLHRVHVEIVIIEDSAL